LLPKIREVGEAVFAVICGKIRPFFVCLLQKCCKFLNPSIHCAAMGWRFFAFDTKDGFCNEKAGRRADWRLLQLLQQFFYN